MKPQTCPKCGEPIDAGGPCYDCKKREMEQQQAARLDKIRQEAYGTPITSSKEEVEALCY